MLGGSDSEERRFFAVMLDRATDAEQAYSPSAIDEELSLLVHRALHELRKNGTSSKSAEGG